MNSIYCGKSRLIYALASALYDSIEDNDYRGVSLLLTEKGADPNVILQNAGISPFHLVIGNNSKDFSYNVTKLILQHGGNPNIKSDECLTPLHLAAAWGRLEIVRLLISCGADPKIRDINEKMAVDYAIDEGHVEIAKLLYLDSKTPCMDLVGGNDDYVLSLEKLILNNGVSEAEYEVSYESVLEQLPQTVPSEYVNNWCNAHSIKEQLLKSQDNINDVNSFDASCYIVESTTTNLNYVNCNRRKPGNNIIKNTSSDNEKTSQESGIIVHSDNSIIVNKNMLLSDEYQQIIDNSSDYFTCNEVCRNTNVLAKNIVVGENSNSDKLSINKDVDIKSNNSTFNSLNKDANFLSITEIYRYKDNAGLELMERRLLIDQKCDKENSDHTQTESVCSKLSSMPATFNYDTDTLRQTLDHLGFKAGPITKTTKKVYLKKLYRLQAKSSVTAVISNNIESKVFSVELESTFRNQNWTDDLLVYKRLEGMLLKEFNHPDPSKKWREGLNKSSFTYLLLDPRVTHNLPNRAETLSPLDVWQTFISSIFYVGKGKRARPYAHLYEAISFWRTQNLMCTNKKLQHILDIWKDNCGVICLHVFQNIIPVEAYTREAAMIKALKVDNIKNKKMGEFYGISATWSAHEQTLLGVYLLYKAMLIFLSEGERQLRPIDIN